MGLTRLTPFKRKHSSTGRPWGFNQIKGADDGKDTVYMTRMWLGKLRVHIFHRGDQDPDCHDHPWGFWTFPLRSYVEEYLTEIRETVAEGDLAPEPRYFRTVHVVERFRWHYRPADYKHRVLGAYLGMQEESRCGRPPELCQCKTPVWADKGLVPTIVYRTGFYRKWGFVKERDGKFCWVPWKTYVYEGGKNGPCE